MAPTGYCAHRNLRHAQHDVHGGVHAGINSSRLIWEDVVTEVLSRGQRARARRTAQGRGSACHSLGIELYFPILVLRHSLDCTTYRSTGQYCLFNPWFNRFSSYPITTIQFICTNTIYQLHRVIDATYSLQVTTHRHWHAYFLLKNVPLVSSNCLYIMNSILGRATKAFHNCAMQYRYIRSNALSTPLVSRAT